MHSVPHRKIATILLVDDSATERTRAVGLLRKQRPDWDVLAADGAIAGLKLIEQHPAESETAIDVVISDLIMPGMDGRVFLGELMRRYPSLPVIVITAQGSDEIAAQSIEMGAVNYVPKRRLGEDLVPAVDQILKSQRDAAIARDVMRHVVRNNSRFRIDNSLDQILALVNLVRDRLGTLNRFSQDTVRELTTAVRESLLNAYYHGNLEVNSVPLENSRDEYIRLAEKKKADPRLRDRMIELEVRLGDMDITFCVTDEGVGFDHTEIIRRSVAVPTDSLHSSHCDTGNGFRLIQQCVDEVSFNQTGNRVQLTRRLQATGN